MAKFGRRELILFSLTSLIILSFLSLIPVFTIILIARTIFGVIVGFLLVAVPKIIVEAVPPHLLDYGFGSSTNTFIYLAVSLLLILGLLNNSKEEMAHYWLYKLIYLFPLPFCGIAIVGFYTLYKVETPKQLIL